MDWKSLAGELEKHIKGKAFAFALMKHYTTWRVGGYADLLVIPAEESDILYLLDFARNSGVPVTVIGNGSNLLVSDLGIRGITLKIAGSFSSYKVEGQIIKSKAGKLLPGLARVALDWGLSGMEFAIGIPSALGGAVVMNAGAHGQQLSDLVDFVKTVDFQGNYRIFKASELDFDYRKSSLQQEKIIVLEVALRLRLEDKKEIKKLTEINLNWRRNHHPLAQPTAGSVFRNPPGDYAARLIEKAGLKGLRIGDACVSEKHANFIVNEGDASASQILELIHLIQEKVLDEFKIQLVPEVQMVGEGACGYGEVCY